MKVTRLPDVQPRPRRVAVGTFDGVHLGHREVIAGADTVLTFEPHPTAVVQPDGTVSNVAVRRSLDPKFGLDQEAVATARNWRFEPGTRDGSPVPVFIMIELDFNLR